MEFKTQATTFSIDGHEISATFSGSRNKNVLGHVKQILLSSFTNNFSINSPDDSLASERKMSDNTPMDISYAH